ncbi:UvrB/UvrC motif-containing protein [uncultured Intestinimonas sp.]|uniref:UvrB/UvrC motif-containing protein n=1 Tax=uncultured Intestinimonas sp. TaxID=1689265 RepID=UPI00342057B5
MASSNSEASNGLLQLLRGPAKRGGACAAQAFCPRQNLGAGRIHFARACEITPGVPRAALPCGARKEASKRLEFEYAAVLRDRIIELRGK